MSSDAGNIWILAHHSEGVVEEASLGLIAEAQRLLPFVGEGARVTAVILGPGLAPEILSTLGRRGAHEVLHVGGDGFEHYRGELFAGALCDLLEKDRPSCFLLAESEQTADLAPRIAARLGTALINRVADLKIVGKGEVLALRPIWNGYVFEEVHAAREGGTVLLSLLPSVLTAGEPGTAKEVPVRTESWNPPHGLKTRLIEVIETDPGSLEVEEAHIVVAGGRGMGKGDGFRAVFELAECLGATVGGTRPVIDAGTLPFERQIGQTGKNVAPRLIVNCAISGANEYTAGMEKSLVVIAINKDPRARIFQFADLGIIADVHELLPLLIARLKEMKDQSPNTEEIDDC